MIPERERLITMNNIIRILLILLPQMLQNTNLLLGLSMKTLLVAHYLQRNMQTQLVVIALQHLTETALAKNLQHLEAIQHMVMLDRLVAAVLVIVAVVEWSTDDTMNFLGILAQEMDLWIVEDLVVLECGQLGHVLFHSGFGCHRCGGALLRRGVGMLGYLLTIRILCY